MDVPTIRAQLDAWRQVAQTQAQRWEGVDPSRLLAACDLIEQLLSEAGAPAPPAGQLVLAPAFFVSLAVPMIHRVNQIGQFEAHFFVAPDSLNDAMNMTSTLSHLGQVQQLRIIVEWGARS